MADAIAALFGDIRAAEGAATMLARFELALLGALASASISTPAR
jgi:DNA repair protein RecO (recombination protein O)